MNELTELSRMRDYVPAPDPELLSAIRARLTGPEPQLATTHRRTNPARGREQSRRWGFAGVAAAALIATGAYALSVGAPTASKHEPGPQAAATGAVSRSATSAGAPSSSVSSTVPKRVHFVNATQVLNAASVAALRLGDPALGAGQYSFTETHRYAISQLEEPPANGAYLFSEDRVSQWVPAGLHDPTYTRLIADISVRAATPQQERYAKANDALGKRQLFWYRSRDGELLDQQIYPAQAPEVCSGDCDPTKYTAWDGPNRANVAALPTDVAALRRSLFAAAGATHAEATKYGKPTRTSALALSDIGAVLASGLPTAELRSALFRVAKTIPGISLSGSMANYDGVRGVAVGVTDPFHVRKNLIFSVDGASFLGEKDIELLPSLQYEVRPGTVTMWTAVTTGVRGKPTLPKGSS